MVLICLFAGFVITVLIFKSGAVDVVEDMVGEVKAEVVNEI